ncbi:putative small metal-binding protein [Vogesella perlucida]|nr:putative small metal-binding protein [Vogesella perlucida]
MSKLYHYTKTEGLFGILSGSLWMTNIAYMNDSEEFDIGVSDIRKHMYDVHAGTHIRKEQVDSLFQAIKDNTFVTSFSRAPDQLSQWRGYCSSGGYCIEFQEDALISLAGYVDDETLSLDSGFILEECKYRDHEEILERIKKSLEDEYSFWQSIADAKEFMAEISYTNCDHIISNNLPFLKNESFFEEQEVRLVKLMHHNPSRRYMNLPVMFRAGRDYIIPYCELKKPLFNPKEFVTKIIVGPGPHKERSINSLKKFLHAKGFDIKVEASSTPLISW